MEKMELARKVLENIIDRDFSVRYSCSEGGACGGGWDSDSDIFSLEREEILYLLSQKMKNNELFENIVLKPIDLDEQLCDIAQDYAWPDGCSHYALSVIPYGLDDLVDKINAFKGDNDEEKKEIEKALDEIKDGNYTFLFRSESDGYEFGEDDVTLELEAEDVLGLLYYETDKDEFFEKYKVDQLDEDFLRDSADDQDALSDPLDDFSYSWNSEEYENFIDGWCYILNGILDSSITEDNVEFHLKYFDKYEDYIYDGDIKYWLENYEEE